jgi:signal transduction histidine kinase
MRPRPTSFRTRILLVVLTVAVIPVAVLGMWLTRSASRSGEALLQTRLNQTLDRVVTHVGTSWLKHRSDLLSLGDPPGVQAALLADGGAGGDGPPADLQLRFDALHPAVISVTIRDTVGRDRWTLESPAEHRTSGPPAGTFRASLPVHQRFPARWVGTINAEVALEVLIAEAGLTSPLAGLVIAAFDVPEGGSLLPLPFDAALLDGRRFAWGGDDWLAVERVTGEPALRLVAAAPLSQFAGPFEEAAHRGTLLLAIVAVSGILVAAMITQRMTRSLGRLATAAKAVSEGHLDARVEEGGTDEVGQVARAFNSMTASLRRAVRELADRERLAAVGEFAASLAHEVRNPLTAIRIDLQRVEEALAPGSPLKEAQARALTEIERLDATVTETLEVARSGRWGAEAVILRQPLEAAMHSARPAFAEREAQVDDGALARADVTVRGDARTLEQVFLNLLLNAAGALGAEGRVWIEVKDGGEEVVVGIRDSGVGISRDQLQRVFDPLYTTKPEGTGLGLTVARRIVEAHGGRIEIESEPGRGTIVRVHLQRARNTEGTGPRQL